MKLSVIVPVYNVSQYISICLDSLLNQDIDKEDYEIIVINDGSTDNSGDIAKKYASNNSNIVLINQENKGLSGARNTGIRIAKGKYIQFVDSDDYLEPNVERSLVDKMERENLDVLRFNYQNVNENNEAFNPNKVDKPFVDYTEIVTNGLTFMNERLGAACYAWQFIIRAYLIKSIPLFMEGIYFEDMEWTPRILSQAMRVSSVNKIVYNYFYRVGSIARNKSLEKKKKSIDDKMLIVESMQRQMKSKEDKRWYQSMIAGLVIVLLYSVAVDFYSEKEYYIKRLKQLGVFPLSNYHLTKSALRKRLLVNISPVLYCWILNKYQMK